MTGTLSMASIYTVGVGPDFRCHAIPQSAADQPLQDGGKKRTARSACADIVTPAPDLGEFRIDNTNLELRRREREERIKSFDPREREAVEYLRWMKSKIYDNYKKFTGLKEIPLSINCLDSMWESFVDFLDMYRRRKYHLRSVNRQSILNQIMNHLPNLILIG